MKNRILLILLAMIGLPVMAADNSVIYRVNNFYETSLKIRVEVTTEHLGSFILRRSRASLLKTPMPRKMVYCADNNHLIEYDKLQRCHVVYWTIDLDRQPMSGINGAGQDDYYLNNGQWLITEAYNFPRFQGVSKATVCVNNKTCQTMPKDDLPLFFIWGKKPTTFQLSGVKINLFTDKQGETLLDKAKLMKWLDARYAYIDKAFKVDNKQRTINMIWLARDSKARISGGLAGHQAFLANYYVTNNQLEAKAEDALLFTSLHEYVHVISKDRYSTWIEESLAEYYASKALTVGEINGYALKRWQKAALSLPNSKVGLYEASNRVAAGANNYYWLLYVKGAAFWNEIDQQLAAHDSSLDQFISYLAETNKETELPKVFVEKISPIIGEETLNKLIKQYL